MERRDVLKQLAALAGLSAVGAPAFAQATEQYAPVNPPQPTSDPAKIEVIEFFHYGCPHCRDFDPLVQDWAKTLPEDVTFTHVPAIWGNPKLSALAQFYYAMETVGIADELHPKVFKAYQDGRVPLDTEEGAIQWVSDNGFDGKKFADAYKSFGVRGKVQRADQLARNYRIRGVPTLAIDGKFMTSASMSGSHESSLKVADQLISLIRQTKKG